MPVRFFGQFLVDEGFISSRQLKDVADHKYYVHRTLGDLAVKRGLMAAADVKRVLELQANTDRYYGELCIEQGLLTREQVEELLEHQRHHHARVGEILVELGHLDETTVREALLRYQADQAAYEPGYRRMPADLQATPAELVLDLIPRLVLRMGGIQMRIGGMRAWEGTGRCDLALGLRLHTTPPLSVAITCDARFGAALLNESRGSVETEASSDAVQRALTELLERVARRIRPGATPVEWDTLPPSGTAFDFISTGGDGLLILSG